MQPLTSSEILHIIRALSLYGQDEVKNGASPKTTMKLIWELSHAIEAEESSDVVKESCDHRID